MGVYTLLCDRIGYHHNRYALDCYAFLLAFTPCDRALVLVGVPSTPASRTGALWAQRLLQLQVSIVYLASGGAKLLDQDWRARRRRHRRQLRALRVAGDRAGGGAPASVVAPLSQPASTSALSKVAIATGAVFSRSGSG